MVVIDGVYDSRTDEGVALRCYKAAAHLESIEIAVEHRGADQFVIVSFGAAKVEEERHLLLDDRSAQIHLVLSHLKGRARRGSYRERVARVQTLVGEIQRRAPTQLVGAGPSENIDTT